MSEGVKYPMLHVMIRGSMFECEQVRVARVELAAAESTALDYARIDALRLAAEKEVDVLAGELEAARAVLLALLDKLDQVAKDTAGAFTMAHIHGMPYKGANWSEEYKAGRAALDRGQS